MSARSKALFLSAVVSIALIGFALGCAVSLHLKTSSTDSLRQMELTQPGSAPSAVRKDVVESLHALQDGYTERDPKKLATLAHRIFPKDGDVLILGTDGGTGEWMRGATSAQQFIENDWRHWGDLQFDADRSLVWSAGNTAWIATIGSVRWKNRNRPIRFTAILTREDDRWVFRQMHFQWDDNQPDLGDLLRRRTYVSLLMDAFR